MVAAHLLVCDAEDAKPLVRERVVQREDPRLCRLVERARCPKVAALALREVPELNARWEGRRVVPNAAIRVGAATALRGGGLVAPALHDTGGDHHRPGLSRSHDRTQVGDVPPVAEGVSGARISRGSSFSGTDSPVRGPSWAPRGHRSHRGAAGGPADPHGLGRPPRARAPLRRSAREHSDAECTGAPSDKQVPDADASHGSRPAAHIPDTRSGSMV
jgi:2-oxoacid dehydrogenase/acyltransferase catalytic subunit